MRLGLKFRVSRMKRSRKDLKKAPGRIEKRYTEAAPLVERVEEVLGQLASLRQIVRFQGEQELVQMALLLAKRVVIEEIRSNRI